MTSQSWQTTLTAHLTDEAIAGMRDWLRDCDAVVPARNDDVLAKYLHCVIASNSQWDGIYFEMNIPRPRLKPAGSVPWLVDGHEWGDLPETSTDRKSRRGQLAFICIGPIVMLAACATLVVGLCRYSPSPTVACATIGHALDYLPYLIPGRSN